MDVDVEFLAACVDFSRERSVPLVFYVDEQDEWVAQLRFSDMNGSYVAVIPAFSRIKAGKEKEEFADFEKRVGRLCSVAAARAHQKRIGGKAKTTEAQHV